MAPKQNEYRNVKLEEPIKSTTPKKLNEILPASGLSNTDIKEIRVSDHLNKIRIVFDSSKKINLNRTIEGDKVLKINFLEKVNLSNLNISKKSLNILEIQPNVDENTLTLKSNRSINRTLGAPLPPTKDKPYFRYYIDLL